MTDNTYYTFNYNNNPVVETERKSEKPKSEEWVNGGFFIFEPQIFEFLNSDCVLETNPLENLVKLGQLNAYKHNGYWVPMDTFRESKELNELWNSNRAPWKNW